MVERQCGKQVGQPLYWATQEVFPDSNSDVGAIHGEYSQVHTGATLSPGFIVSFSLASEGISCI